MMKRIPLKKIRISRLFLCASSWAAGAAEWLSGGCSAAVHEGRKPNIILLVADDAPDRDYGFLENAAWTPNIDRLMAESAYFSNAYCTAPICTPSRYSVLTGRYASRCGHENVRRGRSDEGQIRVGWNTPKPHDERALPDILKANGYVTGAVGKMDGLDSREYQFVPLDSDPADPDIRETVTENQRRLIEDVKRHGFDFAENLYRSNLPMNPCRALRLHNLEWTVDAAVRFINQNQSHPFFLYFCTTLPHIPDPLESLKGDPLITEAGFLCCAPDVQPSRQSVLDRVRDAGLPEAAAPATWLDDGLGAIIQEVDRLGLGEDTLIIYINDNGGEDGKVSLYQTGVKVPTLMRWTGRIVPGERPGLFSYADIVPTVLRAAGVPFPEDVLVDGVDQSLLFENPAAAVRSTVYAEIGFARMITDGRWKYIAIRIPPSRVPDREERIRQVESYRRNKMASGTLLPEMVLDPDLPVTPLGLLPGGWDTERVGPMRHYPHYIESDQLYDLDSDPGEQRNLADHPECRDQLERMRALLKAQVRGFLPDTFWEFSTAAE